MFVHQSISFKNVAQIQFDADSIRSIYIAKKKTNRGIKMSAHDNWQFMSQIKARI